MRPSCRFLVVGLSLLGLGYGAAAQPTVASSSDAAARSTAPADASVYFVAPRAGAVVSTHVHVVFGTRNFGVAPAGVSFPNTGHHHLLVDTALPPLDQTILADRNHIHFGTGATETTIELPPGRHTLQLLLGDAAHVPHNPPVVSQRITIFVRAKETMQGRGR